LDHQQILQNGAILTVSAGFLIRSELTRIEPASGG
jgi:hypothetical protein